MPSTRFSPLGSCNLAELAQSIGFVMSEAVDDAVHVSIELIVVRVR
jgi:hypothetical protein